MIRNNAVMAFLKERGYRTIHLASPWAGTRSNPFADEVRADRTHVMDDDFTRALVDTSLLGLYNSRFLEDMAQFHLGQFARLEATAAEPGPKMVFCHFLLPHHPYVFDRTGGLVANGSFVHNLLYRKAQWRRTDAYIEQLEYLNTRLARGLSLHSRREPRPAHHRPFFGPRARSALPLTPRRPSGPSSTTWSRRSCRAPPPTSFPTMSA